MKQVLTEAMATLPSSAQGRSSRIAARTRPPLCTPKTTQRAIARKQERQKMICQPPAESMERTISPLPELAIELAITRSRARR